MLQRSRHPSCPSSLRPARARLSALVFAAALAACSKPAPPVVTPKEAKVVAITTSGLTVHLRVDAYNPNRIPLSARSVTAHVLVDGTHDLGQVTVAKPVELPPGAHVDIEAPLAMRWSNLANLAAAAATRTSMPVTVEGTVAIGGARISIDVPFRVATVLTHDQLVAALRSSIPNMPKMPTF